LNVFIQKIKGLIKLNNNDMKNYAFALVLLTAIVGTTSAGCGSSKVLSTGSSLMSALGGNPNLSTITSLLQTPGLGKLLGGVTNSPFTLLAPTNDAFKALGPDAVSNFTKPDNIGQLANLVKNQIVPGKLDAASLIKGGLSSSGGSPLNLSGVNLGALIGTDKANIISVDKILQ
jgi:uncharacterized surface protein with fasciclin (FAS1) repeats